jgi:hypothetical protein
MIVSVSSGGVEVEVRVAQLLELDQRQSLSDPVDDDQVLDAGLARGRLDDREHRAFGGDHAAAGVSQQMGDLPGGKRVVDRERDGAEVKRRGVDHVELRPVAEHQGDRVARFDAERREPAGHRSDPIGVLAPGHGD